jgi:hypothetical protein
MIKFIFTITFLVGTLASTTMACNLTVGTGEFMISYSCDPGNSCPYGVNLHAFGNDFRSTDEAAMDYWSARRMRCSRNFCNFKGKEIECR